MKSILLPFEFRTAKVRWERSDAHIKGWYRRADGTLLSEYLRAEVTTSDGKIISVPFPLEWVPAKQLLQCVPALSDDGRYERLGDTEVEAICSEFEPELLVANKTSSISGTGPKAQSQVADAWELREEFLQLKLGWKEVLAFLNRWGSWDDREFTYLPDILNLQQVVLDALASPPDVWFATNYAAPPMWQRLQKPPYFTLRTEKCEMAVRMTVTIDLLNQTKFKKCARPDCGMTFEVRSNHDRAYCRPYCSHLESMRRKRKIAKQEV